MHVYITCVFDYLVEVMVNRLEPVVDLLLTAEVLLAD